MASNRESIYSGTITLETPVKPILDKLYDEVVTNNGQASEESLKKHKRNFWY